MKAVPNLKYSHIDKFEHAFAYAFLSFFWFVSCELGKVKIKLLYLIMVLVAYGVVIEILQTTLTASRTGDLLDVLANSIGVLVGWFIFKILRPIYLQV